MSQGVSLGKTCWSLCALVCLGGALKRWRSLLCDCCAVLWLNTNSVVVIVQCHAQPTSTGSKRARGYVCLCGWEKQWPTWVLEGVRVPETFAVKIAERWSRGRHTFREWWTRVVRSVDECEADETWTGQCSPQHVRTRLARLRSKEGDGVQPGMSTAVGGSKHQMHRKHCT